MRIPNTPSSLWVTPTLHVHSLSLEDHNPRMNGWNYGIQWQQPLSTRIVSSGEVTLSFLSIQGYKCRTEDLEGDSRSKIIAKTGCETPHFMLISENHPTLLDCWTVKLNTYSKNSFMFNFKISQSEF